ncbi:MAG: hypothetical protein ACUZ8N_01090 [Candidatus Scalindua sp.]
MNPELGWTKGMIDYMKMNTPLEFSVTFPIRINIQNNYYSFIQKDSSAFMGEDMEEESKYFGQTRFDEIDYYHEDGTPDVDAYSIKETYELLAQVDIKIEFYDHKTFETEELKKLRSETYKYGYLAFWNPKEDSDGKPMVIICLNKECGIKKKIDNLFVKSKIFNHKSLNIDIEYDSEFMKDIEYEKFCTDKNLVPIKEIHIGGRFALN